MSMSISAVVVCEDVSFAGVAAVLETAGQVAGVGACLASYEGLTPSAVLRSLSLDEKPMFCVLAMRVIDNVSDQQMQLTYFEGFAAKNAVMQVGGSEHGDGDDADRVALATATTHYCCSGQKNRSTRSNLLLKYRRALTRSQASRGRFGLVFPI